MPSFENYFRESKGKPFAYEGDMLHLADFVPFTGGETARITFVSTSSEWRQGIKP